MTLARKVLILIVLLGVVGVAIVLRAQGREARFAATYPPQGQMLSVDGVQVHAYVTGSGPDLVLIHGASGNWRDMTFALVPALADRYRVIVFDRPGLGYSARLGGQSTSPFATRGETPEAQARLLQKAAAQLGADRPIVIGHSFGGAVALAWAAYLPDNIAALVDVAGAVMPFPGELDIQYRVMNSPIGAAVLPVLVSALVPRSYVDSAIDGVFAPETTPSFYAEGFGAMLTVSRARFRANAQQVNGLNASLKVQSLLYTRISTPTEILHGTADTTVPIDIHSRPLAGLIPGAVLTEIAGAGHMIQQTRTADIVAAIERAAARAALN